MTKSKQKQQMKIIYQTKELSSQLNFLHPILPIMGLVDYRGGDSPGKNLSLPEKNLMMCFFLSCLSPQRKVVASSISLLNL